jgi:hypothetical protein
MNDLSKSVDRQWTANLDAERDSGSWLCRLERLEHRTPIRPERRRMGICPIAENGMERLVSERARLHAPRARRGRIRERRQLDQAARIGAAGSRLVAYVFRRPKPHGPSFQRRSSCTRICRDLVHDTQETSLEVGIAGPRGRPRVDFDSDALDPTIRVRAPFCTAPAQCGGQQNQKYRNCFWPVHTIAHSSKSRQSRISDSVIERAGTASSERSRATRIRFMAPSRGAPKVSRGRRWEAALSPSSAIPCNTKDLMAGQAKQESTPFQWQN